MSDFIKNHSGGVAFMWGLSLMAVLPMMGLTYDYYSLMQNRQFLQSVFDSASLQATKIGGDTDTLAQNAYNYIQTMITLSHKEQDFKNITVSATETEQEGSYDFVMHTDANAPLTSNRFGHDIPLVLKNSISKSKKSEVEVVLVLDVSGSMDGQKIADLRTAAKSFIDNLFNGLPANATNIRVGVVPYSGFVNIKTSESDYLGNIHNWSVSGDHKTIVTSLSPYDLTNQADWNANRNTYDSFHSGNMWQYMDVTQNNKKVNGYYIDGALYNGDMNDGWENSFVTVTDERQYNGEYSPQSFLSYRIDTDGNYVIYDKDGNYPGSISTKPNKPSGTTFYTYGLRPFSHDNVWGYHNSIGSDSRQLAVWNNHFWLYNLLMVDWPGCVMSRSAWTGTDYDVLDIPPDINNPETLYVADPPIFFRGYTGYYSTQVRANFYGLLSSSKSITPDGVWEYYDGYRYVFPGLNAYYLNHVLNWNVDGAYYHMEQPKFSCPSSPLMPLQTDSTKLKTYIDNLQTAGNTNTGEGIKWGWNLLSNNAPFTAGSAYGDSDKIMVVITDGANYFGDFNSYGAYDDVMGNPGGSSESVLDSWLDQRMLTLCQNVKDAGKAENPGSKGIEIYTLAVSMTDAAAQTAKSCATSSDSHFYDVSQSSQIDNILAEISQKISKLYVSK